MNPGVLQQHCAKLDDGLAAIVGDIAPGDGVSKEEKNRRETEAMDRIQAMLGKDSTTGERMIDQPFPVAYGKTPPA